MIREDYVSFEVAKLLKEKGFNEPCISVYEEKVLRTNTLCDYYNSELSSYICAPTLQMAMKWLREVHKLVIDVEFQIDSSTWKWRIYHIEPSKDKHTNFQHYNTYEDTCEVAIKYCLENLVQV